MCIFCQESILGLGGCEGKKKNSSKGQGLGVRFHPIQGLGGALVGVTYHSSPCIKVITNYINTHPSIKRKAMTIH
jgi:hypothetical protein